MSDRCAGYRQRLDLYLAALSNDSARLCFLDRELARWERLFDEWSTNPSLEPGATAWDYAETISDIERRRSSLMQYVDAIRIRL
jgi:hypothetical protein